MKKHGIRRDCGDYMVAVQWYELEGDKGLGDDYSEGQPLVEISNSSKLRPEGFSMIQLSGKRLLNARARRDAQADCQAELTAKEVWYLSPETRLLAKGACRGHMQMKRQVKLVISPKQRAKPAASRTRTCRNTGVCLASGECPSRF
jgi:hypothetical protein